MPRDDLTDVGHPSFGSAGHAPPPPTFTHLRALTDETGMWEHACYSEIRHEHGFCTDDNARALVVTSRQAGLSDELTDLMSVYLGFVMEARTSAGRFHNRRSSRGHWVDDVGSDDSQGRAWWGLGAVTRLGPEHWMRQTGLDAFEYCGTFESPHLRANAYAALGASEVVDSMPDHQLAIDLLDRVSGVLLDASRDTIPWPEARLTYDNARIPEALIAAGMTLGDQRRVRVGIRLLDWLVESETSGDRFSFVPAGGQELGGKRPAFDQQPLEAWAMTDAGYRAWSATGDPKWKARALCAASWLVGKNDSGTVLYDRTTGSTGDGLTPDGINQNRGAESTLAGLGTLQTALRFAATPASPP